MNRILNLQVIASNLGQVKDQGGASSISAGLCSSLSAGLCSTVSAGLCGVAV